MYKFVGSDGGSGQKRLQASRACESCRRKKKRCHHLLGTPGTSPNRASSTMSTLDAPASQISESSPVAVPRHAASANLKRGGDPECSPQYVGALPTKSPNGSVSAPEIGANTLIERSSSHIPPNRASRVPNSDSLDSRFIGDLSPESIFLAATSPDATRGISKDDSVGVWLTSALSRRNSPSSHQVAHSPSNLFYGSASLVHKVLVPLLEQECISTIPPAPESEALARIYFEKLHPVFPVISESQYRSLPQSDPGRILLQQGICLAASKNFAARRHLMLAASDQPLSSREFGDKLTGAMRISIEMGLVTDKVILIQALALMSQFIDGPDGGDLSSQLCARSIHHVHSIGLHLRGHQREARNQYGITLLCCIWSIDRMNAAINGRPVLMHDRDIRQDFAQCIDEQEPCFRLFLQVILLLDQVIGLYRPSSISNAPSIDEAYPSFEDLVVRVGGPQISTTSFATIETLYHAITILSCRSKVWAEPQKSSTSYLRQILSTSILSSTVSRELKDQLALFPFVPYAMSLSLSIVYREMRYNKVPLHRIRAQAQFQAICNVLSELEEMFRSASTTARMGRKLLKEMNRVASVVGPDPERNNFPAVAAEDITAVSRAENALPTPTLEDNGAIIQPIHDFDPTFYDSIADIDLFGMFDPAFNLDDFDACLEGNLNPGLPTFDQSMG